MIKKNIVWITPGFASDESDSQCIPPLQLLAKELALQPSINLRIITLHYPFKKAPYLWHGIQIYPCFKKGIFSKKQSWIQALKYIYQLHQKKPIQLLHSFWLSDAALLAYWSSCFLKIAHWVTLAGQDARSSNRYLPFFPLKNFQTIAVSEFHAEVWKETTRYNPQLIIPWGIPRLAETTISMERSIDILGVGNLIELKDYFLFVEMVKELKEHFPNIKAVLIGEGVERKTLEQKIKQEGLTNHLQLVGKLPREEVLLYMQRSKVFFHPSTYESFGFVFVEALARGLHIVSRPTGIAFASSNWWIGNTSDELLNGLIKALNANEQPESNYPFPIKKTVTSYLQLYEDL